MTTGTRFPTGTRVFAPASHGAVSVGTVVADEQAITGIPLYRGKVRVVFDDPALTPVWCDPDELTEIGRTVDFQTLNFNAVGDRHSWVVQSNNGVWHTLDELIESEQTPEQQAIADLLRRMTVQEAQVKALQSGELGY